jgi:hypothetical protein
VYESKIDSNLNKEPEINTNEWKEIDLLSLYLNELRDTAIDEVIRDMVTMKKLNVNTKTLLKDEPLYSGPGRPTDWIVNDDKTVGVEINPRHNARGVKITIDAIAIQADGQVDIPVKFWNSGSLWAEDVMVTANGRDFSWTVLPTPIVITNDQYGNHDPMGSFYITYDQVDLDVMDVQVIKKDWNWEAAPCASCNPYNRKMYNRYNPFFSVRSFSVKGDDLPQGGSMWDTRMNSYQRDTNWGINLRMSVECDVSQIFCHHKDIFADALSKKIKIMLMEEMMNSIRNNDVRERVTKLAQFELQDRRLGGGDLKREYQRSLEALEFDFSGLSKVCLPCNQDGIKVRSVAI